MVIPNFLFKEGKPFNTLHNIMYHEILSSVLLLEMLLYSQFLNWCCFFWGMSEFKISVQRVQGVKSYGLVI